MKRISDNTISAYAEDDTVHVVTVNEHYILPLETAQRLASELHFAIESARTHQIHSLEAAIETLKLHIR